MITPSNGDVLQAGTEAIVNTVNTVGIMGKGIALQFKQAYPANYEAYRAACERGAVKLGQMFVFDTGSMINPRWIINFPTKAHWKAKSRLEDIKAGLVDLRRVIEARHIKSVAVPPLGCGNGGLDWRDVEPVIRHALDEMPDVKFKLYAPDGAPHPDAMRVATTKPSMSRGRALVLGLLKLYGAVGYKHTMLEVQKLTYLLQAAGEDLRLRFRKHHYGPYADNLNHVLQRIEGHYIRGYGDRSRTAEIYVLDEGEREAESFLASSPHARDRLNRVAELIAGFETPYGLELLATVHWVATHSDGESPTRENVIKAVQDWNPRKAKLMRESHIVTALRRLQDEGWLSAAA